ncbi:MAG: lipase family protein [Leptolyngbya sp. RL_3_1]|nr:lipase family protein [Leptolyngbya sp. RL_3_1]
MLNLELALQCARLSQEVYGNFASIKFSAASTTQVTLVEAEVPELAKAETPKPPKTDTQAAILYEPDLNQAILVFRGSESKVDWFNNAQFRQKTYPYGDDSSTDVRFHRGFMAAYFAVRDRLQAVIRQYPTATLVVTGHSLGGALATIAALDLQYNITQHSKQPLSVYTFGAPRVGNAALVESFSQRVPNSYRFVYGRDLVTHLPRVWQGYRHVPAAEKLPAPFTWKFFTQSLKDHEIINYVSSLKAKVG